MLFEVIFISYISSSMNYFFHAKTNDINICSCDKRFVATGKRLLKSQHIMEELESIIEDKNDRSKVLEGMLGYILSSTKVLTYSLFHAHIRALMGVQARENY